MQFPILAEAVSARTVGVRDPSVADRFDGGHRRELRQVTEHVPACFAFDVLEKDALAANLAAKGFHRRYSQTALRP